MAPESFESALDRLLRSERLNRRRFVGRAGSAALAGGMLSTVIAACGGAEGAGEDGEGERQVAANHPKQPLTEINFSNWPLYVDKAVNRQFERRFDVELNYREDINDNDEFFGKVRQPLQQDRAIGRDLVALTDWMCARWIRLDFVEPIDKRNVPNERNLEDSLRNPVYDRGRRFTLPWQSGMTAIGYDRRRTGGEITSIEQFFDARYKGRVTMLADARDAASMVLFMQGVTPEEASVDEILGAIEFIDQKNREGHIRRFTGNDYTKDLTSGNITMAQAYSGDIIQLQADNRNLRFSIPEEGAILWSDNMMIPQKAEHPYGAEVYMNYVYDPEVAAKIAAYVNYVTPVKGAQEVLAQTDPELAEDPLIFPEPETLGRLSGYPNLSVEEEQQVNEAFEQVVGG